MFTGHVPSVFPYYALADLFVLPSEEEGLGIVTMEAMACGCPVLASRVGATLNLIDENKDGFLFESGNVDELAGKIKYIYEHKNLAQRVAAAARDKAKKEFGQEQQIKSFLKIYRNLSKWD